MTAATHPPRPPACTPCSPTGTARGRSTPARHVAADQLGLLLDAARWAPSASNTQPWRFLAGRRGDRAFDALLAALAPGNQAWARDAAALVLVAAETADEEGTPRPWATYDAGQAGGAPHRPGLGARPRRSARWAGSSRPTCPPCPSGSRRWSSWPSVSRSPPTASPRDTRRRRLPARGRRPLDELLLDVA